MGKMRLFFKLAAKMIRLKSPEILIGTGLALCTTGAVLSVAATPKAENKIMKMVDDVESVKFNNPTVRCPICGEEIDNNTYDIDEHINSCHPSTYDKNGNEIEVINVDDFYKYRPTSKDIFINCWRFYLVPTIVFVGGAACIIFSNRISARRSAAILSAYELSELALSEYKKKAEELYGEKKAKAITDEIEKDKVTQTYDNCIQPYNTGRGNTLCRDAFSGRYFLSDINDIEKAVIRVGQRMLRDPYDGRSSYNDLNYEMGLEDCDAGKVFGWKTTWGVPELCPTSCLTPDGTPCYVVAFSSKSRPRVGYDLYD